MEARCKQEVDSKIGLNLIPATFGQMVDRRTNPVQWLTNHIPKNQAGLETEFRGILKIVFWAALLAPVIIIPAYYLLVAFGLLPGIHLPG